jgi:hypothetical protein
LEPLGKTFQYHCVLPRIFLLIGPDPGIQVLPDLPSDRLYIQYKGTKTSQVIEMLLALDDEEDNYVAALGLYLLFLRLFLHAVNSDTISRDD